MKKLLIIIFLFLFPVFVYANFDLTKWQYNKNINEKSDGLVRFTIDDEIFSNTERGLQDLRIIDSDNSEIPFKLMHSKVNEQQSAYYPRMINNSYLPGQFSSVILDFGENPPTVNRLTINTSSNNFQRNVNIYGSDDPKGDFSILKEKAYIYDYTDIKGSFKSQNTIINFPDSIFRYIKIEVLDDNNTQVNINSVNGYKYTKTQIKELIRTPAYTVKENQTDKFTEIYIDLGLSGLPTNKIQFSVSDKNFNRGVSVFSSLDNNNWRHLGNNYIFRYNTAKFTGDNLSLDFSETNDRYLKIIIRNKDNNTLKIDGVNTFSIYREVIFQISQDKDYKVYYGNQKARFPEYDIESYFQYLDLESAKDVTLSKQNINPEYVPEAEPELPITERIPYLMPGFLILISLVLLFFVFKFFQKK
ncbi:hypothetical protein DRH27_03970 [Candidatus Falkowbacteria bacterium]|nr:MAG: hypothetical protein DRH27_03970 [Candidatus Falkowbacteria bacterium]